MDTPGDGSTKITQYDEVAEEDISPNVLHCASLSSIASLIARCSVTPALSPPNCHTSPQAPAQAVTFKRVVFKRLKSKVYPLPLMYAGAQIKVVVSLRYLGLDVNCSKSLDTASGFRAEATGRPEWTLSSRCRELGIQGPAPKLHL